MNTHTRYCHSSPESGDGCLVTDRQCVGRVDMWDKEAIHTLDRIEDSGTSFRHRTQNRSQSTTDELFISIYCFCFVVDCGSPELWKVKKMDTVLYNSMCVKF